MSLLLALVGLVLVDPPAPPAQAALTEFGPPIRRRGTRTYRAPYPQVKRHRTRKQRENDFLFLQ